MEDRKLEGKLLVVTDSSGSISSAMWPGVRSEGAPTELMLRVGPDKVVHELDIPDELYEAARPDLSSYRVKVRDRGATLVRIDRDD